MGEEKSERFIRHLIEAKCGFNARIGRDVLGLFFKVVIGRGPNEDSAIHLRVLRRCEASAKRFLS
jgi:hypothetical protein